MTLTTINTENSTRKKPGAKPGPKKYKSRSTTKLDVEVGNRIRIQRLKLDMSQESLGNKLKVSFQQIQKYEKGVNRVAGNKIFQLCSVLDCDPNYLLGWEKEDMVSSALSSQTLRMALRIGKLPEGMWPGLSTIISGFENIDAAYEKHAA